MTDTAMSGEGSSGEVLSGISSQGDVGGLHGRNRITSRAIRSVVSAITASELHTSARAVGVELADDNGALAVTVSAPVGVPALSSLSASAAASTSSASAATTATTAPAGTVLERASAAQQTIRTRVRELTGSTIGSVNLRLTSARITANERVR